MRCLAVCQDELVIRMLDKILLHGFEMEFIVEQKPLARRLHDAGIQVTAGDPQRTDTFVKADLGPGPVVLIDDNGRRSLTDAEAVRDAGALVYVLGIATGSRQRTKEESSDTPTSAYPGRFLGPLLTEFGRSLTRAECSSPALFSDARV